MGDFILNLGFRIDCLRANPFLFPPLFSSFGHSMSSSCVLSALQECEVRALRVLLVHAQGVLCAAFSHASFRSQLSDVWFTIHTALAQSLLALVPEMVGTCRR